MHVLPDVSQRQACLFKRRTVKPQHLGKPRLHPSPQDRAQLIMSCLHVLRGMLNAAIVLYTL